MPITAIISLIAVVGSFLYGYDTIVMAVERSASEESATVEGVSVNHQYSKSLEFERRLADLISSTIDPDLTYGSALRPYSELAIARAFARLTGYHATFCSCNAVFRQTAAADDRWCGNCPKCRFVGLMLAPFVEPAELTAIIGRDMFTDPDQIPGFAALISDGDKPFECVGERRESAAAIRILADLPRWRDTAVVAALRDRARAMVSAAAIDDLLVAEGGARLPRPGGVRRRGPAAVGGGVTLEEVCAQRVAVWGIGHEGLAMDRLLVGSGVVPTLIDDRPDQAQARLGAGTDRRVMRPDQVVWGDVDVVVRAPGVSRYRPELVAAAASGVSITTAMAVWLEDFAAARVVAVTGTKGKSTTAALTASVLRHQGLEVALIGNIGVPVTDMYGRDPVDAYVVEVSSYQAAEVTITPPVCVLTSLAPDHLDWHRGEEAYYRDKLRLIDAGPIGALAVNAGSAEAVSRTRAHPTRTLFGPSGRVRVDGSGTVMVDDLPMVDADRLSLPGLHNAWNLCGALAGALLLTGQRPSTLRSRPRWRGSRAFPPAARRWGSGTGSPSWTMHWPPTPSPRWLPSAPSPIGR